MDRKQTLGALLGGHPIKCCATFPKFHVPYIKRQGPSPKDVRMLTRFAIFGASCALASCFFIIANLGERPQLDRIVVELALFAPLAFWFLSQSLRVRN